MFGSLRNLPILSWHASADELVPTAFALEEEQTLSGLGYNFQWDLFAPAEHLTLALNDQFAPAATFLGSSAVNVNPPQVTFVRNPSMDDAAQGVVDDHAYWVSAVKLRNTATTTGTIDVFSQGFGVGDPPVSGTVPVVGTLTGGKLAPLAFTGFKNTYGGAAKSKVVNALRITATNIASLSINPGRAHVNCAAELAVTSDGPLKVTLTGCANGAHSFTGLARPTTSLRR
jgi:hypothetical protein